MRSIIYGKTCLSTVFSIASFDVKDDAVLQFYTRRNARRKVQHS